MVTKRDERGRFVEADQDIKTLEQCAKALMNSSNKRMLRANLEYLWDAGGGGDSGGAGVKQGAAMTEKLRGCPFCGGEAAAWNVGSRWKAGCLGLGIHATCDVTPELQWWCDSEQEAIGWWNRRAPVLDEGLVDQLRALVRADDEDILDEPRTMDYVRAMNVARRLLTALEQKP